MAMGKQASCQAWHRLVDLQPRLPRHLHDVRSDTAKQGTNPIAIGYVSLASGIAMLIGSVYRLSRFTSTDRDWHNLGDASY